MNDSLISTTFHFARPQSLRISLINLALFSVGALITIFAYTSLLPLLAAALFFGVSYLLLCLPKFGGFYERKIFSRVFAVGFVMAGFAAIYANYLFDAGQLYGDAGGFFDMAAGQAKGLSLIELQVVHEGALAIVIWGAVYDFFAVLGFPRERYVGISVNVTAVALTGVVALKIARLVFGDDNAKYNLLTTLIAGCGIFWLFAGIHVRDSIVLLSITLLTYGWVHFLSKPDIGCRLFKILGFSFVAGAFMGFLRSEFVFVPIAMALAGTAALMWGRGRHRGRAVTYVLVLIGFAAGVVLLSTFGTAIEFVLFGGREGYTNLAAQQAGADSLGMALIGSQPLPIRLVLGSIYLFVFPIPFWVGFQSDSAYTLFKSFNVILFYFVMPLLVLSLRHIWKNKNVRTPAVMFLLFLSIGFTFAIAGTSLETRHFGAFLVPIFLLVLLPDLRLASVRKNYMQLLLGMLLSVALVHTVWVILKL